VKSACSLQRKERRKEGRKDRRKDGRKEGQKEGWKEGRKDRKKEGGGREGGKGEMEGGKGGRERWKEGITGGEDLHKRQTCHTISPRYPKNLQKLAAEGSKDLDQLVQAATSVYYNGDLEKKKMKDKRLEALTAALWVTPSKPGPNPQTCSRCGRMPFLRECPQRPKKSPLRPYPICKGTHWKVMLLPTLGKVESTAIRAVRAPRASHPGSCNHSKKLRSPDLCLQLQGTKSAFLSSVLALFLLDPVLQIRSLFRAY
jgi:hypothetical protein